MGTVTGELIQMNAKMVVTGDALGMIIVGTVCALMFALGAFMSWLGEVRRWWLCLIGFALFAALAAAGFNRPRVKEIHACANGPVALEQVGAVYDIVRVDGKELVLRER